MRLSISEFISPGFVLLPILIPFIVIFSAYVLWYIPFYIALRLFGEVGIRKYLLCILLFAFCTVLFMQLFPTGPIANVFPFRFTYHGDTNPFPYSGHDFFIEILENKIIIDAIWAIIIGVISYLVGVRFLGLKGLKVAFFIIGSILMTSFTNAVLYGILFLILTTLYFYSNPTSPFSKRNKRS